MSRKRPASRQAAATSPEAGFHEGREGTHVRLQEGLVVAGHGRHCVVETPNGMRRICHPRGKKNQTVVGDHVLWQPSPAGQGDEGSVEQVLPRRNLLYRQDEIRSKSFAANIDQVLILIAAEPVFSENQLARALVAATYAGITPVIALNKSDLTIPFATAWARLEPYRQHLTGQALPPHGAGVQCPVIALNLTLPPQDPRSTAQRDTLMALLEGRRTLVLGPSGSGKSTLVNLLVPDARAATGEISRVLNSGKHTTTSTTLYWLDARRTTALIDSPGFQEFGLRHIPAADLPSCMPDIASHAHACRFYNCTHLHEPGCAVIQAAGMPPYGKGGAGEAKVASLDEREGANTRDSTGRMGAATIHPSRYRIYAELRAELGQPPGY